MKTTNCAHTVRNLFHTAAYQTMAVYLVVLDVLKPAVHS